MSVYEQTDNANLTQTEVHLYGSSRLGIWRSNRNVNLADLTRPKDNAGIGYEGRQERGYKFFELSNHLGNVLVTVSDRKLQFAATLNSTVVGYYLPDLVTANDYYPFGMGMAGRKFSASGAYRYGFNGKENDNDVKGQGNQQDYGMRIYDPRIGKFLSVDPLTKDFPWNSVYAFAENDPISCIDLDGGERQYAIDGSNIDGPVSFLVVDRINAGLSRKVVNQQKRAMTLEPPKPSLKEMVKERKAPRPNAVHAENQTGTPKVKIVIPIVYDPDVLMRDIDGSGIIGKRSWVVATINRHFWAYKDAVAANISGGPIAALGYYCDGDIGSFYGAALDGMFFSFGGIQNGGSAFPSPTTFRTMETATYLPNTELYVPGKVPVYNNVANFKPLSLNATKTGGNIALGVSEYLDAFARNVNGSTWQSWGAIDFQTQFLETINNPANKIHFNLDGVASPWGAITEGAKGFGTSRATSWELFQIYSNPGALQRTTFYQEGKVVPNPF
jgi:RHS repeat-associated protein